MKDEAPMETLEDKLKEMRQKLHMARWGKTHDSLAIKAMGAVIEELVKEHPPTAMVGSQILIGDKPYDDDGT